MFSNNIISHINVFFSISTLSKSRLRHTLCNTITIVCRIARDSISLVIASINQNPRAQRELTQKASQVSICINSMMILLLSNHQLILLLFFILSKISVYYDGLNILKHEYITVTSKWAWWRLKSPASRLFTQPFIQAQIKENIKAPHHWPLCGKFTGDRWIPCTKGELRGKFCDMAGSCLEQALLHTMYKWQFHHL